MKLNIVLDIIWKIILISFMLFFLFVIYPKLSVCDNYCKYSYKNWNNNIEINLSELFNNTDKFINFSTKGL